jgi:hypothetical protein
MGVFGFLEDIGPRVQVDRTTNISEMNVIVYYWKQACPSYCP